MYIYKVSYSINLSNQVFTCISLGFSVEECRRNIENYIKLKGGRITQWYTTDFIGELHLITKEVRKSVVYNNPILIDRYIQEKEENEKENQRFNKKIKKNKKDLNKLYKIDNETTYIPNKSNDYELEKKKFIKQLQGGDLEDGVN